MPDDDDLFDAPRPKKASGKTVFQPAGAQWSLDRLPEVQSAYQTAFKKNLPLANKGQGSIHNKWGYDHRNSADVSLNPSTPEGQQFTQKLREMNVPFLAFNQAIPGVATGPHIHIGFPSHRTTQKFNVGTQRKEAATASDDLFDNPKQSTQPATVVADDDLFDSASQAQSTAAPTKEKTPQVTSTVKDDVGEDLTPSVTPAVTKPLPFQESSTQRPTSLNPIEAVSDILTAKKSQQATGLARLQSEHLKTPKSQDVGERVKIPFKPNTNPSADEVVQGFLSVFGPEYGELGKRYKAETGQNILNLTDTRFQREPDGSYYVRPSRGAIDYINAYGQGGLKAADEEANKQKQEYTESQNRAIEESKPDIKAAEAAAKRGVESPTVRGLTSGAAKAAQVINTLGGPAVDKLGFGDKARVMRAAAEEADKRAPLTSRSDQFKAGLGEAIPTAMMFATTGPLGAAQLPTLGAAEGFTPEERIQGGLQGAATQATFGLGPHLAPNITGTAQKALTGATLAGIPVGEAVASGEDPTRALASSLPYVALPFLHKGSEPESVSDRPLGLDRFQHLQFGEVHAAENQSGVGQGRVRVVDESGTEHVIQKPNARGAGNERAIPLKPAEAQPADIPLDTAGEAVPQAASMPIEPSVREGEKPRQIEGVPLKPEVDRWFGKSAVVDEKGAPLVVYRGESGGAALEPFDRARTNERGFFFTPDQDIARIYSRGKDPNKFILQADKVLDLTKDDIKTQKWINKWGNESFDDWTERQTGETVSPADAVQSGALFDWEGDWSGERWKDLQATAEHEGYDAVVLPDWDNEKGTFPSVVVFRPEQIHNLKPESFQPSPQVEAVKPEVNVPEKPATIDAQLDARGYSLIPNDNPRPPLPRGYRVQKTADGVVYYDPKRIDAETIKNTPITELLGHVEPKSTETTETVVARKPDGTEIQSSAVSLENVEKQAEVTQANFPDAQIETGGPELAQKVIADRLQPDTTSIKNAAIEADRAAMGLPNLTPADRVTWQESIDHAQAKGLDKPDEADHLADRVLSGKQKGLNDEESAGLELRIRELQNQHNELSRQIWAERDPAKIEDLRVKADDIEQKFNRLSDATKKGGSEVARALAFRRSAINENYDLVSLKRDFKTKTGKEPTGKILERLEKISRELRELKARLGVVEEENAKLRAEAAIRRIKRDVSRETQRASRGAKKASLDDEAVQLKDLIAQAWKRQKGGSQGAQPFMGLGKFDPEGEIAKLVLKLARNRVQKGTVTASGLVEDVHGLLKDVIDDLDKRTVREMISGYGRTSGKRSDLQKQLDDLKSELYQGLAAEDVAAGRRSVKSEGPRPREGFKQTEGPTLAQGVGRREGPRLSESTERKAGPRLTDAPIQGPRQSEARSSGIPLEGPKLSDINKVPQQGPKLSEGIGRKEGPRITDAPLQGPKLREGMRSTEGPRLSEGIAKREGPKITDAPKQGPRNTWPARQKAIEKQITEIERKIAAEDFSEKAKHGQTVLSPEAQKLADRLQAKKNEYQNLKRQHEPWNWLRNFSGIRKAGMLSGYVTHIRNILGTGGYIGFEEARRVPSIIADAALSTLTGRRTATLSPTAMLDGVIQAVKTGGKEATEIMRHGATREDMARHQYQEINTGSKVINTAANLIFRAMSASDRVFYQGSYKRNLVERAQAQAITEWRADRSIKWRERAKELVENPTKEMESDAKHDALVSTFNNNNRLSDAIKRGRGALGAGGNFALDLVLPFDRTPTNVIARVIEASPAGYAKNVGQLAKALWNKNFSAAEQRAFVQTFGRATTGTAITALGFALAAKGLLTTDDYGTTYLEFRGRKINLSAVAPMGTLLGVGAGLQKQYIKGDATKRNYAGAVTKPISDQPLLKASSQVSDFLQDPNRSAGKLGAGMASSFIPASGAVRTIGEAIDPAQKRYSDSSFKEQFQRNIPKWRESLPASRVRLLGSEVNKATKEAERLGITIKGAVRQEDETAEDFKKREALQNGNIRTQLENVVDLPDYDKASDSDKREWLKQASQFASQQTKESLPEKPEKVEKKQFPMPVGFDRVYPVQALKRFERMSEAQRGKVRELMADKAWLLTHSPTLSEEQKADFKARLDKLGIIPRSSNQPKMTVGQQYKNQLTAP